MLQCVFDEEHRINENQGDLQLYCTNGFNGRLQALNNITPNKFSHYFDWILQIKNYIRVKYASATDSMFKWFDAQSDSITDFSIKMPDFHFFRAENVGENKE